MIEPGQSDAPNHGVRVQLRPWSTLIGGCLILLVLLFGFLTIPLRQLWNSSRNHSEYSRNKAFYESILRRIEGELTKQDQTVSYMLPGKPEELRSINWSEVPDRYTFDKEHRLIRASRLKDGRLRVSFETFDLNHAGYWYLIYLSGDLPLGDVSPAEATPVAPHWWAVEDHSG